MQNKIGITAFMNDYIMNLYHVNARKFLNDPETFFELNTKVSARYGFDGPSFSYDVYNIEAEAIGQELLWLGNALPEINPSRRLLQGKDDFKKLKPPIPGRSARMLFVSKLIKLCTNNGVHYNVRFCAPFTLACNLRGYRELVIDILENPESVHRLFTFLTDEVLSPWIEFQRNLIGGKVYALGADAMCSLPLVSPGVVEEFALKYIMRLQQNIGNLGTRGWRGESTLKEPRVLLDLKVKANPRYLDCVDPDIINLGPKYFRYYSIEKDIPLVFGIDPKLISTGSSKEIRERISNYIVNGYTLRGLTINLMHVPSATPEQNLRVAVETVRNLNAESNIGERS
jgi:uroporphyrinogen-III decarboxylase